MQKLRATLGGLSPIAVTALLSVLLLVGVSVARVIALINPSTLPTIAVVAADAAEQDILVGTPEWQQQMLLLGLTLSTDASAATSTDHLSMIGPMIMGEILGSYEAIRANGDYTKEDLRAAAEKISVYMKAAVSYDAFENSDFRTDSDVSAERVRVYRDNLQDALSPISAIPSAEYEIYARYEDTKDTQYLAQLKDAANTYRASALSASRIQVPNDAINYHRDLLNSLRAFSSVLDGLADHADDPFASIALLRTYNEKEQGIYDSFNRMRSYYAKRAL